MPSQKLNDELYASGRKPRASEQEEEEEETRRRSRAGSSGFEQNKDMKAFLATLKEQQKENKKLQQQLDDLKKSKTSKTPTVAGTSDAGGDPTCGSKRGGTKSSTRSRNDNTVAAQKHVKPLSTILEESLGGSSASRSSSRLSVGKPTNFVDDPRATTRSYFGPSSSASVQAKEPYQPVVINIQQQQPMQQQSMQQHSMQQHSMQQESMQQGMQQPLPMQQAMGMPPQMMGGMQQMPQNRHMSSGVQQMQRQMGLEGPQMRSNMMGAAMQTQHPMGGAQSMQSQRGGPQLTQSNIGSVQSMSSQVTNSNMHQILSQVRQSPSQAQTALPRSWPRSQFEMPRSQIHSDSLFRNASEETRNFPPGPRGMGPPPLGVIPRPVNPALKNKLYPPAVMPRAPTQTANLASRTSDFPAKMKTANMLAPARPAPKPLAKPGPSLR